MEVTCTKWAPEVTFLTGRGVSELSMFWWPSLPYEPPPHVKSFPSDEHAAEWNVPPLTHVRDS